MKRKEQTGLFVCFVLLLFAAVACAAPVPDTAPTTYYPVLAEASNPIALTGAAGKMLQFKAGVHVLGFQPNKANIFKRNNN